MTGTPTGLYDTAAQLLASCAAGLAASPHGPPATQYVSEAEPAFDCDQLTVHVVAIEVDTLLGSAPGLGMHRSKGPQVNLAQLAVTLCRCTKVVDDNLAVPTPAEHDAIAQAFYSDGWYLWEWLRSRAQGGTLLSPEPDRRELRLGPLRNLPPSGGIVAWRFDVLVAVEGFPV